MSKRGRKRTISHEKVIEYAINHPDLLQRAIAEHFGITQCQVAWILHKHGIKTVGVYRGRPLKRQPGWTDEQYRWEKKLHDAGLGMDRGLRLNSKCIFFGYDPHKENNRDESATLIPNDSQEEDNGDKSAPPIGLSNP